MKLITTTTPFKQPENTYRFALNAVTDFGSISSLANEQGNTLSLTLPGKIKGSVYMYEQKHCVFLDTNTIGIVDLSDNSFTEHVTLDEFGFSELADDQYVTGVFFKHRGCDDVVLFFDGVHTNKFVNFSRPEFQQTGGQFDINLFEFNTKFIYPDISYDIVSGGRVKYGRFQFVVEFFDRSGNVIFRSPLSNDYVVIDVDDEEGALNDDIWFDKVGGKPVSNKAIKVSIDNVPDFIYSARLVAIRYIYGDGYTYDVVVTKQKYSVQENRCTLYYRGYNPSQGDFIDTIDKYIVPEAVYNIATDGILVENHLVIYNLKEQKRDFSKYQQYASKVRVKYVVKEVPEEDASKEENNRTFCGNEILALYIHYVYSDGQISPGFPLVNRSKTGTDTELVEDPRTAEEVERWKIMSTSIPDVEVEQGYKYSGFPGYVEIEEKYITPPNYCGSDYWGSDYEGNSLEGRNIRLFRMPGRYDIPHFKNIEGKKYLYPIGLKFDNIEYPDSDIKGHFFSVARVPSNIISTGVNVFGKYFDYIYTQNPWYSNVAAFLGDNLYLNTTLDGDAIVLNGTFTKEETFKEKVFKDFHQDLPYKKLELTTRAIKGHNFYSEYGIFDIRYRSPLLYPRQKVGELLNKTHNHKLQVFISDRDYHDDYSLFVTGFDYVNLETDAPPITQIFGVRTEPITNINENVTFRGKWFISPLSADFIDKLDVEGRNFFERLFGTDATIDANYEVMYDFFIESRANLYKRVEGVGYCHTNPRNPGDEVTIGLYKIIEPYQTSHKIRDSICPFFPAYNPDYSLFDTPITFESISWNYDFCSKCIIEYPTRYAWSRMQSTEEQSFDLVNFLAVDYYDLPQDTGEIVKMDYINKKLIIRTKEAMYITQPNTRNLTIEEEQVAIGTGKFLSIEPVRMNMNATGYGGQQNKIDSIVCDRGLIWINTRTAEVHLFNGKFNDIHVDIFNVLRKHIKQVPTLFTYDNNNKRFIMTNKGNITLSYCFITNGWKSFHSYLPEFFLYDYESFYSVYENGIYKHDNKSGTSFYNYDFPFIFEVIDTDIQTFIPKSVFMYINVTDSDNNILNNKSITRFLAYNSRQSTGIKEVRTNDISSVYWDSQIVHCKIVDNMHKISPIRDHAVSNDIWTDDISPVKVGNNQGWIDRLPHPDNVRFDKPAADLGTFKDKWIAVRGWFEGKGKIIVELAKTNVQRSYR